MLNWIKKYFNSAAGLIPDAIRQFVYDQIYAVMSFVGTIINHVAAAWNTVWHFVQVLAGAFDVFGHAVFNYFARIVRVLIPGVLRWAGGQLAKLNAWVLGWIKTILHDLDVAKKYLEGLVTSAVKWTINHVWAPLWAAVTELTANLRKWGYTAWWYITHPADLADLLLLYLVASLQRGIWNVARIMGDFLLRIILSQMVRSITLIEQILSDVL